jgi:hypothetical protein
MNCHRCGNPIDDELIAKLRILQEIFAGHMRPKDWTCQKCNDRPWARFRRRLSNLFDPVWWKWEARYEIPRWLGMS